MWKKHLTISEAAEFLGVSAQTLRSWDKSGRLPAHRGAGNQYRLYKISDLEKLGYSVKNRGKHKQRAELLK